MDKQRLKSLLYNYEVKIVTIVTDGVIRRDSKTKILRRVRAEILRIRLSDAEQNQLWQFALQFYRHTVASAARETDVQKRAEKVYAVLRQDVQTLEHQKNAIADSIEYRLKHDELVKNLNSDSNFFYCTAHKNPAEGHAAYQGRIYYRKNGILSDEEKKFVRKNKLLAVEDVVLEPIWLTTRRNCKHRLIPIPFESAKTGSYGSEIGSSEISYEEEQYNTYKDRLKMMVKVKSALKKIDGVEDIPAQMKVDIRRTYKLCRAWRGKIKKSGK